MSWLELVRLATARLGTNRVRAALTMLGIIIGVGAVITMLAVGTGARERISEQMASIGSNLLIVMPGSSTSGGVRMGGGTQSTLTQDDAEAIAPQRVGRDQHAADGLKQNDRMGIVAGCGVHLPKPVAQLCFARRLQGGIKAKAWAGLAGGQVA